jgi:hypothetical protein
MTRRPADTHSAFARFSVAGLALLGLAGCGAAVNHDQTLAELRAAIAAPVTTPGDRQAHNDLVVRVTDEGALEGLLRDEVTAKIGRGRDCSEFPLCLEREFEADDWVYEVGTDPAGGVARMPTLIVGFDASGRVMRTTYITR